MIAAALPTGWLLVVGYGVALVTVLQVLILGWLVNTARSARATARGVQRLVAAAEAPAARAVPITDPKALDEVAREVAAFSRRGAGGPA